MSPSCCSSFTHYVQLRPHTPHPVHITCTFSLHSVSIDHMAFLFVPTVPCANHYHSINEWLWKSIFSSSQNTNSWGYFSFFGHQNLALKKSSQMLNEKKCQVSISAQKHFLFLRYCQPVYTHMNVRVCVHTHFLNQECVV